MAFTDVEMAILSQCAYCDYPDSAENQSLYQFLLECKPYLNDKLGGNYDDAIDKLIDRVKDQPYTLVQSRDDKDGTGFAAFAVADPDNEVTVVCRGTEFSKIGKLKPQGQAILTTLIANGITGKMLLNTPLIYKVLTEQGLWSEGMDDVIADIQLAFLQETEQQQQMAQFVDFLERGGYSGYHFTGHSLGGNLAMYGAVVLKDQEKLRSTVTFNAPGFNQMFWQEYGEPIGRAEPKFRTYQNERDAISECFQVPGNIIIVDCVDDQAGGIKAHGMNQFVLEDGGAAFTREPDGKKETTGMGLTFGGVSGFGDFLSYTWHNFSNGVEEIFSPNLSVPVEQLKEYARKMQEYTDDSADVFDRIYNSLTCLRQNKQWQGLSLDAIVDATRSNQQKFDDVLDELQRLANFLKRFAEKMEETDKEVQRRIDAV